MPSLIRSTSKILSHAANTSDTTFNMVIETTADNELFTIGCHAGFTDANVDWGDGSTSAITTYNDADLTHTYASASEHTIVISGTTSLNMYGAANSSRLKVKRVLNFGNTGATQLSGAFRGCENMTSFVSGNCDTSSVYNMSRMFQGCTSLTTLDVSGFDTSSVTAMNGMFQDCNDVTSLDVSGFNTSLVTNMYAMFYRCRAATAGLDVSSFDTSSVTNMQYMFQELGTDNGASIDIIGVENFNIEAFIFTNSLRNFMTGVAIPTARYDSLLINWDAQDPLDGLSPTFGSSQYTAGGTAAAARANLISTDGWTITDGGTA